MHRIKKVFLLVLIIVLLLTVIGCEKEKPVDIDDDKDNIANIYGDDVYILENNNRTFIVNLDCAIGTDYAWSYEVSLNKIISLKDEQIYSYNSNVDGGNGKYRATFEADIDITNGRRIVITYVYNDSLKTDKHPKTYEFTLFVTYEGDINFENMVARNLNGPDENEHVWIHTDAVKVTCEHDGHSAYDTCEICGEVRGYEEFKALGGEHQFELTSEVINPTKENPRQVEYTCKKCGETTGTYVNALDRNKEGMNNLNILLIGNSYTNYNTMMNCLKGVIEGEGIKVNIVKVGYGGAYLYNYVDCPDGTYYKYVTEATEKTKFDIVFLQDQSTNPATNPNNFYENARWLYNYFSNLGATCIMYETWTRKGGYSGWSEYEMTKKLSDAYTSIGRELNIRVSHCGLAVYDLLKNHPEISTHNSDNSHPSTYTSYVVALCHYATIYGRSPIGINYKYNDYIKDSSITWHSGNERVEITDEMQAILEQAAYNAVFNPKI